jgi:hypothetical protein
VASTAVHGVSGPTFHPIDQANATADCLENLFTPRDQFDCDHERRVEATVQAFLTKAE